MADRFDRIKPPGRLEPRPDDRAGHHPDTRAGHNPDAHADPAGRLALYSQNPQRPGTAVLPRPQVQCAACAARTPLTMRNLLRAVVPVVLIAPWRTHPFFAVCPACRRRAWLRVRW